jgi:hypothetical protein
MNAVSRSAILISKVLLVSLSLFGVLASPVWAQAPTAEVQLGTARYGSFGGSVDVLNLATLNAHFVIPILHKPGRGLPFDYDLTYDTTVWQVEYSQQLGTYYWNPIPGWGWNASALNVGFQTAVSGYDTSGDVWVCENAYHDGFGTPHWFVGATADKYMGLWDCAYYDHTNGYHNLSTTTQGSSCYTFTFQIVSGGAYDNLTATNGNGIIPQNGIPLFPAASAGSVQDRNGNMIKAVLNVGSTVFEDTLGLQAAPLQIQRFQQDLTFW